ncbi:gluconokinase [Microbacterium sp. P01]|uniref:gluconokinase n=1 Tax=Microbacterium sp. P01 TaxID=3366261 RepID=UPI00366D032A
MPPPPPPGPTPPPPGPPGTKAVPIVVMGVSAAGKTSVAKAIAAAGAFPFVDADALHPAANVAKMARGEALEDVDRWPWLDDVAHVLADGAEAGGIVVACSALRRRYRDRLRAGAPGTVFVHLTGAPELLAQRAAARTGHFMPPALLRSQLDTLENLGADEAGVAVDVTPSVADVAATAVTWLAGHAAELVKDGA